MSQVTSDYARSATLPPHRGLPIDLIAALIFVLLFAIGVHAFQYRDGLAESDGYRVLIGLLDGEVGGTGIASTCTTTTRWLRLSGRVLRLRRPGDAA